MPKKKVRKKFNIWKCLKVAGTVITLLGAIYLLDDRFALSRDLVKLDVYVKWVELRLDQKVEADALEINENRLIRKRADCKQRVCTQEELIELELLEKKVEKQQKKLEIIQQRIIR